MARCMLKHANLPLRFWDAAVLTACYLRNRLPVRSNKQSPHELMNGSKPILSHLRVWGCICYALIDEKDPHRYKLLPTSLKGIFVGYCESKTQYRVYIPSKPGPNKIIISANVQFQEDQFWDWNKSSNEQFGTLDMPEVSTLPPDSNPLNPNHNYTSEVVDRPNITNEPISPALASQGSSHVPSLPNSPNQGSSHIPSLPNSPTMSHLQFSDDSSCSSSSSSSESQNSHESDQNLTVLRRSNRVRKPIAPRSAWQPRSNALYVGGDAIIPKSYSEAIIGVDRIKWQEAIKDELQSLREKNVFSFVTHVPHDRKPIGSRWIFSIKADGRYKARLVAQGFRQVYGVDYFETYSPTLSMDSLRILLAVSAFLDFEIHQIDIKTAYLEGDLDEEVYLRCPQGIETKKFIRLNKALYGLKQAGKAWYEKLNSTLTSLGFSRSSSDHCIYINHQRQFFLGVYVDDMILCAKYLTDVDYVKNKLMGTFDVKDLGEVDTVIGWKITRDRTNRKLCISQRHYILDKIRSFGLCDSKPIKTPCDGYDGISSPKENEELADDSAYASLVGSLGYASNGTRPDISFITSQLGTYNASPALRHYKSACRVLKYLKSTINLSISFSFGPSLDVITPDMMIKMYSDSDFASDTSTRKSVSGYILMIGGGPVCWQSRKQKSVSTSTTEAEYVALSETCKQAVWTSRLLNEFGVGKELIGLSGMQIFTDSQSALALSKGTNSSKTKHIDVAHHYVRDCVENKGVKIDYISTEQMLADVLTKPLPPQKLQKLLAKMLS